MREDGIDFTKEEVSKVIDFLNEQNESGKMSERGASSNRQVSKKIPVVGICGAALGIINNWEKFSEDQRKKYSISIAENADLIINLISNILGYSKLKSKKPDLSMDLIDLSHLVDRMIQELQAINDAKNQKGVFIKNLDPGVLVQCDKYYINLLMSNLITNALSCARPEKVIVTLKKLVMPIKAIRRSTSSKVIEAVKFAIECYNKNFVLSSSIFELFSNRPSECSIFDIEKMSAELNKKIVELHKGKIWREDLEDDGVRINFLVPLRSKK